MRSAWISGALDEATRASLSKDLQSILPGTAEQRGAFLGAADEALDIYRKLLIPLHRDFDQVRVKLARLAETARAFVDAVGALDDDASEMMEAAQWVRIFAAADSARVTASAAERLVAEIDRKKKTRGGPRLDKPLDTLITHLAEAYALVFGEQPSASRGGLFASAIRKILAAGGVKLEWHLNETDIERRLTRILKKVPKIGEAPRRGRKRQKPQDSPEKSEVPQ